MSPEQQIIRLLTADTTRIAALHAVKTLHLPDWLIAAGFVRNKIWDDVFGKNSALGDIDVIYYCLLDTSEQRDKAIEQRLRALEPGLPWSVKNQARMHLRNGDSPYKNTLDAMSYWPEKQTALGVMLDDDENLHIKSCFDLALQFNRQINRNPAKPAQVFQARLAQKNWLEIWPELRVVG